MRSCEVCICEDVSGVRGGECALAKLQINDIKTLNVFSSRFCHFFRKQTHRWVAKTTATYVHEAMMMTMPHHRGDPSLRYTLYRAYGRLFLTLLPSAFLLIIHEWRIRMRNRFNCYLVRFAVASIPFGWKGQGQGGKWGCGWRHHTTFHSFVFVSWLFFFSRKKNIFPHLRISIK